MSTAGRRRVFESIFPSVIQKSVPTPTATPLIGAGEFPQASFQSSPILGFEDPAAESIKWERAWHNATAFLSLRNAPVDLQEASLRDDVLSRKWIKPCTKEISSSIAYVVSEQSVGHRLRGEKDEYDLLRWYCSEVERHYVDYQVSVLHYVRGCRILIFFSI